MQNQNAEDSSTHRQHRKIRHLWLFDQNLDPVYDGYEWGSIQYVSNIPHGDLPPSITTAFHALSNLYKRAYNISQQNDPSSIQINYHIDALTSNALLLLEAMSQETQLPDLWIHETAEILSSLVRFLKAMDENRCVLFLLKKSILSSPFHI